MKIKIIEYFWSVGHKTRRKGSHKMPLVLGQSLEINRMTFKVHKIEGGKITLNVLRYDGTLIKELVVEKGKSSFYRPFSMDAGHQYTVKITRF